MKDERSSSTHCRSADHSHHRPLLEEDREDPAHAAADHAGSLVGHSLQILLGHHLESDLFQVAPAGLGIEALLQDGRIAGEVGVFLEAGLQIGGGLVARSHLAPDDVVEIAVAYGMGSGCMALTRRRSVPTG